MICPKCKKEFLSADKFCPYCGEPIEVEEKTVKEPVEETAQETATEVSEEIAEGAEETAAETDETAEDEEYDPDAAKEVLAAAADAEKKAKTAVKVLATLVVIAAVVIIALVAMMFVGKGGEAEETAADTTASDILTDETADVTGEAESTEIVQGAMPFEGVYPEDYQLTYADGYSYKDSDISEFITLGNYKGQTAEVTLADTVSEEEFANQINYFLMQYAELGDAVTDRPAALNDTVLIDYAGTVDGVAFDGGTATDQTATLGMGQFIPGFEEGIVGMNIGETKDVHVTFPENYGVDTLNGKEAVFTITLKSITENVLPDYTDDFVMANFGIATVAEFEQELRAMNAEEAMSERYSAVLTIITDSAVINSYPEGTVEDYIYQQMSSDMSAAAYYGMSVEDYISMYYGMDVSTYEAQVSEMAKGMVAQELALYAVAKAEGIEVTDEDMATEVANFLEYYGAADMETLCSSMGVSEELLENSLHFSVVYNKVMEFMMENTTFIVAE